MGMGLTDMSMGMAVGTEKSIFTHTHFIPSESMQTHGSATPTVQHYPQANLAPFISLYLHIIFSYHIIFLSSFASGAVSVTTL